MPGNKSSVFNAYNISSELYRYTYFPFGVFGDGSPFQFNTFFLLSLPSRLFVKSTEGRGSKEMGKKWSVIRIL